MTEVLPGSFRAFAYAARPRTLAAAFVPVMVGAALASRSGGVRWLAVAVALFGACLIQIGTNYANDVYDFERGADDDARIGPARAAQSGWLTPRQLRVALLTSFGLAALSGLYLVYVAGPWLLAIGITSIVAGLAYTGGPYPLAYHGLGDVFVIVFFGLVAVLGTAFVAGATPTAFDALAALAVGVLANGILVVNNLRDREGDARVGKKTVIVRFGRRFGIALYGAGLVFAYAVPLVLVVAFGAGRLVLLPWLSLPLAIANGRAVAREDGAALNVRLAKTAAMLVLYGLLFAVGLGLDR